MTPGNWIDRALAPIAPQWYLKRLRSRMAADLVHRHYEGASVGRRTQGWRGPSGDANSVTAPYVGLLRERARDLVRNNGYAESALATIVDHTVGWGITAKPAIPTSLKGRAEKQAYRERHARFMDAWNAWANSTACDADGRHDLAGLQKLVTRTTVESGEVLVRRRIRRPEDNLPLPFQLQVLEPDYLDTLKHGITLPGGGRIVYGVEFDGIGRRVAYWLFPEHPGNSAWPMMQSERVPASAIRHVFKPTRAGAIRGASWFAPVILRMKDFDEFEDATLMKQKIAACLAIITTDVDGSSPALGTADDTNSPGLDSLEPGLIHNAPPGRSITVVQPPTVREYADYVQTSLRGIAAGLGVTYEDLTGDYTELPFSAARMSRLRHWARVDDWRWRMLIPQFCDPVWNWALEVGQIMSLTNEPIAARWTAPPMPMIEPDKEGLAYQRNIRSGIMTQSEAVRERGYDPEELFEEMADDNATLDRLKLILDSDPRQMTQAGQLQGTAAAAAQPATAPPKAAAEADDEDEAEDARAAAAWGRRRR